MKKALQVFAILGMSFAHDALASQSIVIHQGSSITLNPGVETTVTCQGAGSHGSAAICTCRAVNGDTWGVQVSVATGEVLGYVRRYGSVETCSANLPKEPLCSM